METHAHMDEHDFMHPQSINKNEPVRVKGMAGYYSIISETPDTYWLAPYGETEAKWEVSKDYIYNE